MSENKMWGGRFEKPLAQDVADFTYSISVDRHLWRFDIQGSIAHAKMLGRRGILTDTEATSIVEGLESIAADLSDGSLEPDLTAEDIHSFVEAELNRRIGPVAGKLHIARSRNDQVATDLRLWTRTVCRQIAEQIRELQTVIVSLAQKHKRSAMPGLTHQQHAQPVTLAHHLLAYFWMLERDFGRIENASERLNMSPLGAAALAGTGFPIDRMDTAHALEFTEPIPNSLDAVSDRDFVVEVISACALIMSHLSRLAQELINWSAPEYKFVELDDAYTTGSSIMPQKKNPDVCELIRGRSARVLGHLTASLALLKALPLAYNRDLQEDKTLLFETCDTTTRSLTLMAAMLSTASFNTKTMRAACAGDFSTATDIADYMTSRGSTFRDAHEVVGRIVRHCLKIGIALEKLSVEDMKRFSDLLDEDALPLLQPENSITSRRSQGGTAPETVAKQITLAKRRLKRSKR